MTGWPSLALATILSAAASGELRYVDDDAAAGGDGTSWATAYRFLRDALDEARGDDDISQIRVAQGVYRPDRDEANPGGTGDRSESFVLLGGVAVLGGYAGVLGLDPDHRDIDLYDTVLSGDLLANDGSDFTNIGDNSIHVASVGGDDEEAPGGSGPPLLEGFTITAGNADRPGDGDRGGGLHVAGGDLTVRLCTIRLNSAGNLVGYGGGLHAEGDGLILLEDCVFVENRSVSGLESPPVSTGRGGAVHADGSVSITATGCTFRRNGAASWGGAAYGSPDAALLMIGCAFLDQIAKDGGAIFATGSLTLEGCEFNGNTAFAGRGGAIFQAAGSAAIEGCEFSGNSAAGDGGVLYVSSALAELTNCTLMVNVSGGAGGAVAAVRASVTLADCELKGNSAGMGGAVAATAASLDALRSTFRLNTALGSGGAVRCATGVAAFLSCIFSDNTSGGGGAGLEQRLGDATLTNCQFEGNIAVGDGGGLLLYESTVKVNSCTITGNSAASGGGVRSQGSETTLSNCIVWGDAPDEIADGSGGVTVRYSNVGGGWTGPGNDVMDTDPAFLEPNADNFRLSAASPCIDAGHNWAVPPDAQDLDGDGNLIELVPLDLDGQPRFAAVADGPDGGCGVAAIVDMGAFEHTGTPLGGPVTPGDFDGTGGASMTDLLRLLMEWGPCGRGCCMADLTLDGTVDLEDQEILLDNWGP